jgi:cytoskeletal protein CcmA (bactofilin family)
MFKKIFVLTPLFVLVLLFGAVSPAHAQGIVAGDTIPAGTTVDDDVIMFGDTVTIDGDVNGNVFALGGTVTVNGKVDGSLFAITQQVFINGEVTDGVYGAALELDFGPEGRVGRNVAFLGLSVSMPEGAAIGRDLTGIFMLGAQFGGSVERDTTAVIGPLEVVRLIIRMFNIQAPPFLAPQTALPGGGKLAVPVAYDPPQQSGIDTVALQKWLIAVAREFFGLLLVGVLALWLFPRHMLRWGEKVRRAPFSSAGLGLAAIVVGIVGLALIGFLILSVAGGIGWIGFSVLGTAFGALGFFAVSTAGALFFVVAAYLSKVIVAFLVGLLILKRYERKSFWFRLGVLALGLLIYVLLAAIPFIGWTVVVVVILIGTGAVFLVINDDRRFEKPVGEMSAIEKPVIEKPVNEMTTIENPVSEKSADEAPPTEMPVVEKPASAKPASEKPARRSSK